MDQLKKLKQDEDVRRSASRNREPPKSVRTRGAVPYRRESQPGKAVVLQQLFDESGDESEPPHEPKVVQLNLKSSLMGVQILDDEKELFSSRKSSMSSMISDKFRSVGAVPFKWESEPGIPIERPKTKIDMPSAPPLMPLPGSRGHSSQLPYSSSLSAFKWKAEPEIPMERPKGKIDMPSVPLMPPPGSRGHSSQLPYSPSLNANGAHPQLSGALYQPIGGSTRLPSGMLYPCPNQGSRPNSCQLQAAHFTFDNNVLTPDLGGINGGNSFTERMFKKLVGQSRLHRCCTEDGDLSGNFHGRRDHFNAGGDELGASPVSTLDCPQSPTSSERSFRGKSKRKSLRRRSDDANTTVTAQVGPIDPATPRPISQLAQYLMSITSLTGDATDDDDLEGPSETAWLEHEDNPYHPHLPVVEGYTSGAGKKKPTHERWSSNSSSWNLSLVQKPLRTVSTIVSRRQRQHLHATIPGSRWGKDAIMPISLTASYDGGSSHFRSVRKETRSELNSGRSWWPELGSGRKSVWACSGRLKMEVAAEPDLHEPDMEQANNVKSRWQQDARAKVDEEDFPFDNPIASSFVFQEANKRQSSARRPALHRALISVIDSENEDLQLSDNYHDPEDGSITDSEVSDTFSLNSEGHVNGLFDRKCQWARTRSFDYGRDAVDTMGLSSSALSGLSGSALSGFLEMGRSGRFSVDLQRGQIIDKAQHPLTPDVRLRIFKSEKSSRRSILSPCFKLPFLHRSHKHVPRIQAAPTAGTSSRRLQPVNSFTARLGSDSENSTLAGQFQLQ